MNLTAARRQFSQTLVNKDTADIVSICFSLIYTIFTENIRAFKFCIGPKLIKQTDSLVNEAFILGADTFLHFWQEQLLQITWLRQHWQ